MQGYRYVGDSPRLKAEMEATQAKLDRAPIDKIPVTPIQQISMPGDNRQIQGLSREQLYNQETSRIENSDISNRKKKKALEQLDANFAAGEQYANVMNNSNDQTANLKYGGWIDNAVKRPGAFTAKANAAGMGVQEYANYVTRDGSQASTLTKRQANLAKTFKKMAKTQSKKQFGGTSKAPQNVTTDGMIQYNKDIMKNAMARNNFEAMAAQEAEALAQQMAGAQHMMPNGQMMPGAHHMQYGGNNNFGYKPNANIGQWADAYGTMKRDNKDAFNNMLGASGELAGAIYSDPTRNDLKLKRLKTDWNSREDKKAYKEYAKGFNQQDQPTDEWDMFNQNVNEMQKKKQPINMMQMGQIPGMGMNGAFFPYGGQPMMYAYGGMMPQYQLAGSTPSQYQLNQLDYINSLNNIPGIGYPDPMGGIGQIQNGMRQIPTPYGNQWVPLGPYEQYKIRSNQAKFDQNPDPVVNDPVVDDTKADLAKTNNVNTETTDDIKDFSNNSAADVVTDATSNNGNSSGKRGNVVDDETTTTTTTTQQNQGQPGQGFFVTQPGSYNLNPTGRWQRGPGAHLGPAVAYNPADTYLDEYTYKGRLLGKGPRKVKMKFSHYGQPGMPALPGNEEIDPNLVVQDPNEAMENNRKSRDEVRANLAEGLKPDPNAVEVTGATSMMPDYGSGFGDAPINPDAAGYDPILMDPNQMAYGGYIPPMMFGGAYTEAFPQAQMYPVMGNGGIPFPEAFPQAQMYPTQYYPQMSPVAIMQGGGQPVGMPQTDPWGTTTGVWGREMSGATQMAAADAALAGMAGLTSIANQRHMRDFEDQMKQKTLGDANFVANTQSDRGKWTQNQGYIDPMQMTPVQFQGMNMGAIGSDQYVKYGGQMKYQDGGEYVMSQAEIDQIYAMGGTVEFLD